MESTTPAEVAYAGLDIAKDRLDYALPDGRAGHVTNNAEGHARLLKLLRGFTRVRVVCEASGGYEHAVVVALLEAGLEVCVVQPGRVRAFAHAEGLLAKTDPIDAALLRRFGEKMQPRLAVPADPASATLRELLEHRRGLSDQLVAVRNRLALAGKTLRTLLERQQRFLEKELAAVETMIEQHIDQDPTLREKAARLRQLQGADRSSRPRCSATCPNWARSTRRNSPR
jgi:transposase